ncbi:MAG: PQQ-binding-like beta-propeller repeat protein, partial [Planctomycetaceae bacterium]
MPEWFRIWIVSASIWGLFLSGATLATALAQEGSSPPLRLRRTELKPPLPATNTAPKITGDSADLSASRLILSQLLYRSRPQQVALERANAAFQSGKDLDGLLFLQQALDTPHDSFQWRSNNGLSSARREARSLLSGQSVETLELYARLHGPESDKLLALAEQSGDMRRISEVARRFFHTSAGFRAVDLQATWWLDRGEFELAAHAWAKLLSDPSHRSRVTGPLRAKFELAERLAHPDGTAIVTFHQPAEMEPGAPVRTAAVDGSGRSDVGGDRVVPISATRVSVPESPFARMRSERKNGAIGRSPYLKPIWGIDFAAESPDTVGTPLANWEEEQIRGQRPLAVANFAHIDGSLVIVRDYEGIRAVHRDTGAPAWKYVGASSLAQAAREVQASGDGNAESTSRQNVLNYLFHLHSGNATLGTLSSDGQRVYAVDHLDIRPRPSNGDRVGSHAVVAGRRSESTRAERITRESNRLIAIDLVQPESARNSVTPAWTIGGTVGAINWFYRMDENDDGRVTVDEFTGGTELFAEIDKDSDGLIRATEADAFSNRSRPNGVLTGHFFLGPPRPVDGRLFAMTECDRQLNLVALDARTGGLLWSQGIGFVDHPVEDDPFRYTLSCSPVFAGGVVICPTQIGVLAGVDASDGALLWAYYYGDDDSSSPFGNWSYAVRRSFGHQGFTGEPEVHGERIVYMPRQSDQIHCLDVKTGKLAWKIPRAGAEYVAALTDDVVMVVGLRYCRGISLATGDDLWTSRLGMPAGRGVQVGRQYLVPLQEGRIATVEISTGHEVGLSTPLSNDIQFPDAATAPAQADEDENESSPSAAALASRPIRDSWRPGNLVISDDKVLSVDSRRIVALPQSEPLLNRIRTDLEDAGAGPDQLLLAGELESTLGQIGAAKGHIRQALALPLEAEQRQRAELLMR